MICDGVRAKGLTVRSYGISQGERSPLLQNKLTPEERNKITGHRQGDSGVYVMYYMSTFIDADC